MSGPNRAERRRTERARQRQAAQKVPVMFVGDGIVAAPLPGHQFEYAGERKMPPKRSGQHRWIATAGYLLSDEAVRGAHDPDTLKFLDHETLFTLSIGCWDCEQPLGVIQPDSPCPAPAAD